MSSKTKAPTNRIDPAALMRIKSLQLRARAVVDEFLTGIHRSAYHGFTVEFSEYRQYAHGDDPKHLDWRLFARSDRYYVKRFEDETNRRCYIVLDVSRSMEYHSLEYTKAEYARTLAATLITFLIKQRDLVGMLTFADRVIDFVDARYRPGHLGRLLATLERETCGDRTALNQPLAQMVSSVRRGGLVVLISDMLTEVDNLKEQLSYLRTRGDEVLLLRILDPSEIEFPYTESTTLRDVESGREIFIDAAQAKRDYRQKFDAHLRQIESACEGLGVSFQQILTNESLDVALHELIRSQVHRGTKRLHRASRRGTV